MSKADIMTNDPITQHFFSGFVRLHILRHVAEDFIYGAEIAEEPLRHGYKVRQGALYPTLHSLKTLAPSGPVEPHENHRPNPGPSPLQGPADVRQFARLATGTTLNVQSLMGAITAIGVVVANANLLRKLGDRLRLRPILFLIRRRRCRTWRKNAGDFSWQRR